MTHFRWTEIPEIPANLKTRKAWQEHQVRYSSGQRKKQYPCYTCEGSGHVRDPSEHDVYEGYKMANWYTCNVCGGSGEIRADAFWQQYTLEYERFAIKRQTAIAKRSAERKAYKKVKAILTTDEMKLLGLHILPKKVKNG